MTEVDSAAVAASLKGAHRRLAQRIGDRWIKGTAICHRSVGRDLETLGLVESRIHHNERQIRATSLGFAVRALLNEEPRDD
jgi:hypothetical protein